MRDRQNDKQQLQQLRYNIASFKTVAFLGLLVIMGVIGLLWFARPKESEVEKRTLTKFPKLTLQGIWDGSFCSGKEPEQEGEERIYGVDAWYADTYPLRELLIAANFKVKNLYGVEPEEQMVKGYEGDAEEIPTGSVDLEELAGKDKESEGQTEPPVTLPVGPGGSDAPVTEPSEDTTAETEDNSGQGAGDVTTPAQLSGTIYITQGCGYGVYYFNQQGSARYCLAVNSVAKALQGKANVYCLICPISAGIMLSDDVREATGSSDENEAVKWMYANMDPSVKTISVYNTLKAHNNEYIYFHTDHHWTALGAYYAYREWAKVKGVTPHELTDFQTYTFPGFLGTFYSSSNQNASLANNPDTVTSYIPNGTNSMTMYVKNKDGNTYTEYGWKIVNDVSNYNKASLYATFAGGDQPYNYAHNEAVTDGSSVLIVKDSYGNAFIPFLVDHYEHIYWIDYRSSKHWCGWAGHSDSSISGLVARKGIQDVILCNNINSTGSSTNLDSMEGIFK